MNEYNELKYETPCPIREDANIRSGNCIECEHFGGDYPSKRIVSCSGVPTDQEKTTVETYSPGTVGINFLGKQLEINEWKELKIDNLEPDILTGDYEFHEGDPEVNNFPDPPEDTIYEILRYLIKATKTNPTHSFYYRKPDPKQPTHEEIMTKWWKLDSGRWCQVDQYQPPTTNEKHNYLIYRGWQDKEWFLGMESATIPPEKQEKE